MALGYVIALLLIGVGCALLVVGILMMRREDEARAEDLKVFLKTGVAPTASAPFMARPGTTPWQRAETLLLNAPRSPQADATRALRRAYERPCTSSVAA